MADRLGSHWPRRLRPLIGATDDGNWCDHLRSMRYPVRELVLVRFPCLPVRALSDPNPRASGGIRLFMEPVLRHLLRLHHCLLPPQIQHAGRIRLDRRRYDRGVHHCGFLRPGGNKKAARIHRELIARGHSDAQEKRPGKPEALHNQSQFRNYLRRLLLLDGVAVADRDDAGLFRFRDLAYQIDMQETVLKIRAFYLNAVGELERALEGAGRDALVKHVAVLLLVLVALLAADGKGIFLSDDGELRLGKARYRDGDAILIVAGAFDIVGRVTGCRAVDALIEQRKQAVKPDGGTIKRCEIESSHGISSL